MLKKVAMKWLDESITHFAQISDSIWDYAELGLQETKSAKLLASEFENTGFQVQRGIAEMPTAFVASYGTQKPVIGILGEYDALSGLSQKPIPQREPVLEGAPGHGCGHNIHGTSGTAAAIAVKEIIETHDLKGSIKFFGCPAEETLVGKVFMVRDGLFQDLDAVFSHHPGSMNTATLGSSNAMNSVKFRFQGVASHAGGSPHRGRSALDAVELMNIGVNFMREHVVPEARIHYIIEEGGGAPNIVPAKADSWYFVRAPLRSQVNQIYQWILQIAEGAALMTQTKHEHRLLTGCYNLLSVPSMANLVIQNMRDIGAPNYSDEEIQFAKSIQSTLPPENIVEALRRSKREDWRDLIGVVIDTSIPDPWGVNDVMGGSTDVADVSWQAPTIEFSTATFALGIPGHSWQNVAMGKSSISHKSLSFAAKTIACCTIDILTKPSLRSQIKDEWEFAKQGEHYVCPLPPNLKPPLDQF
jgi:aminobenzoyl-glutamate utilization protein B